MKTKTYHLCDLVRLFEKIGNLSYLLAIRDRYVWRRVTTRMPGSGYRGKQEHLGVEISEGEAAMILFQCRE